MLVGSFLSNHASGIEPDACRSQSVQSEDSSRICSCTKPATHRPPGASSLTYRSLFQLPNSKAPQEERGGVGGQSTTGKQLRGCRSKPVTKLGAQPCSPGEDAALGVESISLLPPFHLSQPNVLTPERASRNRCKSTCNPLKRQTHAPSARLQLRVAILFLLG